MPKKNELLKEIIEEPPFVRNIVFNTIKVFQKTPYVINFLELYKYNLASVMNETKDMFKTNDEAKRKKMLEIADKSGINPLTDENLSSCALRWILFKKLEEEKNLPSSEKLHESISTFEDVKNYLLKNNWLEPFVKKIILNSSLPLIYGEDDTEAKAPNKISRKEYNIIAYFEVGAPLEDMLKREPILRVQPINPQNKTYNISQSIMATTKINQFNPYDIYDMVSYAENIGIKNFVLGDYIKNKTLDKEYHEFCQSNDEYNFLTFIATKLAYQSPEKMVKLVEDLNTICEHIYDKYSSAFEKAVASKNLFQINSNNYVDKAYNLIEDVYVSVYSSDKTIRKDKLLVKEFFDDLSKEQGYKTAALIKLSLAEKITNEIYKFWKPEIERYYNQKFKAKEEKEIFKTLHKPKNEIFEKYL